MRLVCWSERCLLIVFAEGDFDYNCVCGIDVSFYRYGIYFFIFFVWCRVESVLLLFCVSVVLSSSFVLRFFFVLLFGFVLSVFTVVVRFIRVDLWLYFILCILCW